MHKTSEYAAYYLERLREGHTEDAYFRLIEADPAIVPDLIKAFAREENRGIRTQIVQCIWQHRRPLDIGFLAKLLCDPEKSVWQEALDGIVAIGGNEAIRALQEAKTKLSGDKPARAITVEWLDEALEQLRSRDGR